MKKLHRFVFLFCVVLFALPAVAQSSAPPTTTFSLTMTALSLPGAGQTVVGTDAGAMLQITKNFQLREDNLLAPASNFEYFGGGFNYFLPVLSTKLDNASPTLSGSSFQFWITASAGVDRIAGSGSAVQHYAMRAGGGVQYKIGSSGTWTFGGEVQYGKFPGLQNNTWTAAIGPQIHF